jgi:hypothetical protein
MNKSITKKDEENEGYTEEKKIRNLEFEVV